MSIITVHCRLVAPQNVRQQLWKLMSDRNTPLVNELIAEVSQHPDFETWRRKGKIPAGTIKKLCEPLRSDPRFEGQPGRFYTSAISLVDYIFKSWLAVQQRLQQKLDRKIHWLSMLKSDEELVAQSNHTLEEIRQKATDILSSVETQKNPSPPKKSPRQGKIKNKKESQSPTKILFETYNKTEDILTRSAVCYLLKNRLKINEEPEDIEKFSRGYRKKEIEIQRLKEQLEGRLPQGRDLTGQKWLETLITATTTDPKDNAEAKKWQDIILTRSSSVPYPINYESNEDLTWSLNEKGRFCVGFNGLKKHPLFQEFTSEHPFQIYCDQRQLKYFQRFYEDQQIKRESKQHSAALFTLRSGRIVWQEQKGKGEPWDVHHLMLYCTLDSRFLTEEGTQKIQQEKIAELENKLLPLKPEITLEIFFRAHLISRFLEIWQFIICYRLLKIQEQDQDIEKAQKDLAQFIKRTESSRQKIEKPFPRPSKPLYKGQPHLLLGVSMRLNQPATVAVVNGITGQAIQYRSLKQLLGENYRLLNRQRQQKKRLSHQRHEAQKFGANSQLGESELGLYIDRLLAKAIVQVAQQYQVGSIVVPKLAQIRENIQSEIQVLAEKKIPGFIEGQKKYAKQYRINIHNWSYGRLIDNIKIQASKLDIVVEEGDQLIRASPSENSSLSHRTVTVKGEKIIRASPTEEATALAISAYQSRSQSIK